MEESSQESYQPSVGQAIRPLLFTAVACGVVIYLLSATGPVSSKLGLDLSFLMVALLGYYIFRLFSRLSNTFLPSYLPSYFGQAAAYVFNGIAFSFFCYHVLGKAMLFTRIPALEGFEWLFSTLSNTTGYVILFFIGYTLSKLAGLFTELPWGRQVYPPANALGQFLVGYSLWQVLAAFSGFWAPMNKLGLVLLAGMLAMAISNVGTYGEKLKNPFIADASRWLRQSQRGKFILGALIATYILFVRPAIVGIFPHAPLIEWAVVCFAAWRLFAGIRSGLQTRYSILLQEADWQKHVQQIANRQGLDFIHLGNIQQRFVREGDRDALLIYLTLLLNDNGLHIDELNRILHPLINHHDTGLPWFAFGWEQRRILGQNQENRQRILDGIIENLKTIVYPAYQQMKGADV